MNDKAKFYTIVTPRGTHEPVKMQAKGDRMWVKLEDLADIIDANLNQWFASKQGKRIISRLRSQKGEIYLTVNNKTWAIEQLALEFVRCYDDTDWLIDKLLGIFDTEHARIIDFSSSDQVQMINEEQAETMRKVLQPLINNSPKMKDVNWIIEAVLKGPTGEIGQTYDGLAADVAKIREHSAESVMTIARVLMDSTPVIRQVIIEAKINGDPRDVAVIKVEKKPLADVDLWKVTEPLIANSVSDIGKAQNFNPVEVPGKAFKTIADDNEKERDCLVNAREIGFELGLNEETINFLLTHYGFQVKQILREKPLICSYHPTVLGLQFCTCSLIIECDVEPDYYYRPAWHWGIIKALENKIKP